MQLNELLTRFTGVKRNGNQYVVHCPVPNHGRGNGDKNPSLSIGVQGNNILLKCFAGCSTEDIVGALGLEMKDLFIEESPAPKNREIAAVYDYTDLDGNIIHSTIRYNPKSFSQRRPDPGKPGCYIWKEVFKGITPILYNLQAVNNAIKEKQPVLIVEGEKDCDNLSSLGFTATTCPMGAGKWRGHYSAMLNGGTVYIIPDNDEAGITHAKKVAKSLKDKAEAVYMADLLSVMPELPNGGDISDFIQSTSEEERKTAVDGLLASAAPYGGSESESDAGGYSNGKISAAEQLIKLVEISGATFFHSDVKDLYTTIPVESHAEVIPINSRDFELWLNGLYYKRTGKPISKDGVKQALAVLSAKALYDNPEPMKLSVRVAEQEGAFWYDLTNSQWQSVRINGEGWEVTDNPPTLFTRYRHQLQQSIPKKGGDINKILRYINIKESKTLFLCWLVSCFIPNIPHAAVIIHGEKGAAKSTASGLLKSLIDPSALDTLTLQNDQRTMAVNLQNHWFLPFDNVSYINEETSDTLCRAITGGGIQQRRLNTNSEDAIFIFQRCIAVNGIHNAATRADLLDRSILVELVRIAESERKELSEIISNFENDKSDILGGIFDTVVKAINIFPAVKLKNLPRMADFARWGYAIGESLGAGLGRTFLSEYTGNRQIQNEEAIANDPVATLIMEFMKNRQEWTGLYSELYRRLADIAEPCGVNVKHKSFPANAIGLSKRITAIKSNMENVGINCEPERKTRLGQTLSIKRTILSSPSSHTQFSAENGALGGEDKRGDRCEDKIAANSSSHPASHSSSHEKPCNYGLCAECEDGADGADKNGSLTEAWYAVAEDISDEDIPPEFLTSSPLSSPRNEQLKL